MGRQNMNRELQHLYWHALKFNDLKEYLLILDDLKIDNIYNIYNYEQVILTWARRL